MAASSYRITSKKNLTANKQGQFSDEQREALSKEKRSYLKPVLLVIAGGVAIIALVTFIKARGNLVVFFGALAAIGLFILVVLGIIGTPFLLIILAGRRKTRGIARDLAQNNIKSAEGEVVWKKSWLFSEPSWNPR